MCWSLTRFIARLSSGPSARLELKAERVAAQFAIWLHVSFGAGELHPLIEAMLWYYRFGKPKATVEHQGTVTLERIIAQSWQRSHQGLEVAPDSLHGRQS